MSILMPSDTRTALGPNAERCDSRSLFMDRFVNPGAKDTGDQHPRRDWFKAVLGKRAVSSASESRCEWLAQMATSGGGHVLYAQLQSRLMVNMAGGAMENAGLCLDRYGLPFIPGSAVKGCARRMAIQSLVDKREGGADANELARLLADAAQIFGWGETDWKQGRKRGKNGKPSELVSDFEFGCGEGVFWEQVRPLAATLLFSLCASRKRNHPEEPWLDLPNFAGSVAFLPAYPVKAGAEGLSLEAPALGQLELDVLTCHHPDYYAGKLQVATDTEPPIPVVFPTVAAGHIFAFALLPLRVCPPRLLDQARTWLAAGLAMFGLGAKTAAGYGWFDASETTSSLVAQAQSKQATDKTDQRRKEAEAAAQKAKEEAERLQREKMKAALASLSPEQQEDHKVAQLSDDQFRSALDNYTRKNAEEQKAIVRALRLEQGTRGSRRVFWDDLRAKAQKKGGKYAQTEQAIRQLSKQLYPGKEGKMP